MMTALDILVATFFAFCVDVAPHPEKINGEPYARQAYECPLIRGGAVFVVWRYVCPNRTEQHVVAMVDLTKGTAWALDQDGRLVISEEGMLPIWLPICTHDRNRVEAPP